MQHPKSRSSRNRTMKQYASIAYILPPYDAGDKYESLLNYDFYQNFFLTILETVTEVYGDKTPPILLCDMYKEVADVNPNDDNSLKNIIDGAMNALDDIKKTIEPIGYTLVCISSSDERLESDLILAEIVKKTIKDIDIAIFNVKDPSTVFNENKDFIAYAVSKGTVGTHLKNIIKMQPVGPLYSANDILGEL